MGDSAIWGSAVVLFAKKCGTSLYEIINNLLERVVLRKIIDLKVIDDVFGGCVPNPVMFHNFLILYVHQGKLAVSPSLMEGSGSFARYVLLKRGFYLLALSHFWFVLPYLSLKALIVYPHFVVIWWRGSLCRSTHKVGCVRGVVQVGKVLVNGHGIYPVLSTTLSGNRILHQNHILGGSVHFLFLFRIFLLEICINFGTCLWIVFVGIFRASLGDKWRRQAEFGVVGLTNLVTGILNG